MKFGIIGFILFITFINVSEANTDKKNTSVDSLEKILISIEGEKSIPILHKLTEAYFSIDLNKSLDYALKSLELSQQSFNIKYEAYSNLYIADTYLEFSYYQKAIFYYEKALEYFYDQKDNELKANIYLKLGDCEKMLGNYDNAIFYYQKPLNLFLSEDDNKISHVYNKIGVVYKLQGKIPEAFEFHQKALNSSNQAFKQDDIATTLNYIGSLYWKINEYDSALVYYEKSIEVYQQISDTLGKANVLNNIGVVYKDIGQFKKSLEYYLNALELRKTLNKKKQIAESYNNIGSLYLSINDYANALEFYFQAEKLREETNDIFGLAQTQNNIALIYRLKDANQKALEYFTLSLSNYQKIGNQSLIAASTNQIGNVYKKLNKLDLALEHYLRALKIQQEAGNQNEVASTLNNIGIIYDEINSYPKALEIYSKSLEIKRNTGNPKEIAYALHIIGNTYLKLEKYTEALDYFNEALKIRVQINDKINTASTLKSIGNASLGIKDYNRAFDSFNDAIKLREEIGDIKGVSDVLNDIGNFYFQTGNYTKAKEYFLRIIDVTKKTGDKYTEALCRRKLGIIQIAEKNLSEGLNNINKSLEIGESIGNLELIKNAYFELYNYFNQINDKSNALNNYINYTQIKDSIAQRFNAQRLIEIQMNYELEKSQSRISEIENEMTKLTVENKIRELEIKKQKNVRNFLIVLTLFALLSGGIILVQFLSKRKTNHLLKQKIAEVDLSNKLLTESEENLKILNATKDKFFSIIAHDLRNPFNALHGLTYHLFNNYHEFTEDELKQSIEIIYHSADDLLELLDNLLQWSRTQRGKMQFTPREINLYDIVKKTIALLQINAEKKNISLINDIKKNCIINADYDMIMTIIRNLVSNAIKFSFANGQVRIYADHHEDYTEIGVIDKGVGITPENIKKLFRIDTHYSTSGTSEEQGSGLGLILCAEFVEKHSGKIWVESEVNKGSIFKFTIPKLIV